MATLIPALGACVSRMTSGERRLAERLEQKLDDDYDFDNHLFELHTGTLAQRLARCAQG